MAGNVAELQDILADKDGLAQQIAHLWHKHNSDRKPWLEEKKELRNFVFATDTTKTSNSDLPWKNKTTLPKLTQIRDNLHANYLAALFPNDQWMRWEAYSEDAADFSTKNVIQAYLENKTREGDFRKIVSKLLYDYIDWGNAFAEIEYVNESTIDPETDEEIPGYIGPKLVRISPFDIVFNAAANEFSGTYKIVRYIKTFGELKAEMEDKPELADAWDATLKRLEAPRKAAGMFSVEDWDKAEGYAIDGFGSLHQYYQSGYVEVLRFEGDISDEHGNFLRNHRIMVIDRSIVVEKKPIPSWLGSSTIVHVGWRTRPDNLYAMGPLDNLVGMQYRIDHLENLKADVFDLIAFPPLKIIGEVEEFEWKPRSEIHIDEGGDVQMLVPDSTALNADTQIALLESKMEEYAGAPKQAMGIRTPGEKTAFEVQSLENAAGRIFQDKVTNFEINLLEPALNAMLESARRNMDGADVVRILDDDLAVVEFVDIRKEDITSKGKIRPIGARHFAARAQLLQNLTGLANTSIWQETAPHRSSKALAKMVEDVLQLERFAIFEENIGIVEQGDTQRMVNQVQEDVMVEQSTPIEEDIL